MFIRIPVYLLAILIAPAALLADTLNLQLTTSWSFTGTGSNGPDSSFSSGGGSSQLLFDLSGLPASATVSDATFDATPLATFDVTPSDADSGCLESGVIEVTTFIQTNACSEIQGADFLDAMNLDGSAPGVQSLNLNGPLPVAIDPQYIHPGGAVPVTLFDSASASFTGWYYPWLTGQTPAVVALSGDASVTGDLTIDYVVAPEPRTAALIIAILTGLVIQRRIQRKCFAGNGTKSRRIV